MADFFKNKMMEKKLNFMSRLLGQYLYLKSGAVRTQKLKIIMKRCGQLGVWGRAPSKPKLQKLADLFFMILKSLFLIFCINPQGHSLLQIGYDMYL